MRFLYFFFLLFLSFSSFANSPSPSSQTDLCSGVTAEGRIEPWNSKLSPENIMIQQLVLIYPFSTDLITFECIHKPIDIVPASLPDSQREVIADNMIRNSLWIVYLMKASVEFLPWLWGFVFASFAVITLKSIKEENSVNTLFKLFQIVALVAFVSPLYSGFVSISQWTNIGGYAFGNGVSTLILRSYYAMKQTGDSATGVVDLDKRVAKSMEKKKGQVYSEVYSYNRSMIGIEECNLKSQNLVYDAYSSGIENSVSTTKKNVLNTDFTDSVTFKASSGFFSDINYQCGSVTPNIANIDAVAAQHKNTAIAVNFTHSLIDVAQNVNIEDTSQLSSIWLNLESQLHDELGIKDVAKMSESQRGAMRDFLQYFFSYAGGAYKYRNEINGTVYDASFNKINKMQKDIATLENAMYCLSESSKSLTNKQALRKGRSKLCGYFENGAFSEMVTNNTFDTLASKAKGLTQVLLSKSIKAQSEIEAIWEKARLKYNNPSAWEQISKEGIASAAIGMRIAEQNRITDDLRGVRSTVNVYPTIDANGYGKGNAQFERLKEQTNLDLGNRDLTEQAIFAEFAPGADRGSTALATASQNVADSVTADAKENPNLGDMLSIPNPYEMLMAASGLPATASFTPEGIAACVHDQYSGLCPIPLGSGTDPQTRLLRMTRDLGAGLLKFGLGAKLMSTALVGVATFKEVGANERAREEADAQRSGAGSIGAQKSKEKALLSKSDPAATIKKLDIASNVASNLGDLFISFGTLIIIAVSGLLYAISLGDYGFLMLSLITYTVTFVIIVVITPIATPVMLLRTNPGAVWLMHTRLNVYIFLYLPLFTVFYIFAYLLLKLAFILLILVMIMIGGVLKTMHFSDLSMAILNWVTLLLILIFSAIAISNFAIAPISRAFKATMRKVTNATESSSENISSLVYAASIYLMSFTTNVISSFEGLQRNVKFKNITDKMRKDIEEAREYNKRR